MLQNAFAPTIIAYPIDSVCRYYHELFLRGRADLCRHMTRTRVKGNGMKAASSPATEPDFYRMQSCSEDLAVSPETVEDEHMGSHQVEEGADPIFSTEGIDTDFARPAIGIISSTIDMLPSTRFITDTVPSALVSPPSSPREKYKGNFVEFPSSFIMPWASTENALYNNSLPIAASSSSSTTTSEDDMTSPSSGDAIFFEGLKFRYLDHLDPEDFQEPFSDDYAFLTPI
jgi:hypothetical protein